MALRSAPHTGQFRCARVQCVRPQRPQENVLAWTTVAILLHATLTYLASGARGFRGTGVPGIREVTALCDVDWSHVAVHALLRVAIVDVGRLVVQRRHAAARNPIHTGTSNTATRPTQFTHKTEVSSGHNTRTNKQPRHLRCSDWTCSSAHL